MGQKVFFLKIKYKNKCEKDIMLPQNKKLKYSKIGLYYKFVKKLSE